MKKVLVTGATGFIGANLTRKLVKRNYEVHILIRKSSDVWRIKDIIPKLHTHQIDLLKKQHLSKLISAIKPNAIFHLANLGLYGGFDSPIEESIKINLVGTINLIKSAHYTNYKCLINTGSSSEYGDKLFPMKENHLCQPSTNYALTKLAGTLYAQAYAKKNHKALATLRLFSPFGPFDHPARFISQTIIKLLRNEEILIKSPYVVRDYIFIDDVIEAFLVCMKNSNKLSGEVFNIGSGKQTTIHRVLQLLKSEIKSKSQIKYDTLSRKENNMWQADIKKAKQKLGWYPKTTLTEGLKETVKWFKENSHLYG